MNTKIASILGLLLAGSLAAQASVITFDSQADYDDYFTGSAPVAYNNTQGGLYFTGADTRYLFVGNEDYDPGEFLTETVSMTFSLSNFNSTPSVSLMIRASDEATFGSRTGIMGMAYVNSTSTVRLRFGYGQVNGSPLNGTLYPYDISTTGLSIAANTIFNLSLSQRNITVSGEERAEVRLVLSNAATSVVYADTNWLSHAAYANYADPGNIGMRIYPGAGANSANVTVHSFGPVPEPVPEPSTYALLGGVLLAGALALRRQKASGM